MTIRIHLFKQLIILQNLIDLLMARINPNGFSQISRDQTKAENKYLSEGNLVYNYSQNGRSVNPKLRSLGFKLGAFRNEVRVGVPKFPAKISIFEEVREAIFQLSVGCSNFHLEFLSVVAVIV